MALRMTYPCRTLLILLCLGGKQSLADMSKENGSPPGLIEGRLLAAAGFCQRSGKRFLKGHSAIHAAKMRGRGRTVENARRVSAQPQVDQLCHVLLPRLPWIPVRSTSTSASAQVSRWLQSFGQARVCQVRLVYPSRLDAKKYIMM